MAATSTWRESKSPKQNNTELNVSSLSDDMAQSDDAIGEGSPRASNNGDASLGEEVREPPKLFARPSSAGNAVSVQEFHFAVAKKSQPKFNHPIRNKTSVGSNTLQSIAERESPDALNKTSEHVPTSSKDLRDHQSEAQQPCTNSRKEFDLPAPSLGGVPAEVNKSKTDGTAQVSGPLLFPFDFRPVRHPKVLSPAKTPSKETVSGEPVPSIEEDANAQMPRPAGEREPEVSEYIDRDHPEKTTPRQRISSTSTSSSLQPKHVVAEGSRVAKPSIRHGRQGPNPSMLAYASKANLTNEQILQMFLNNIRKERTQATASQRQLKSQIEQLVRVNNDYQTKLEEAEQEIEEQGREIDRYRTKFTKWKDDLSHLNGRMTCLVVDHAAMSASATVLREANNNILSDRRIISDTVGKCRENIAAILEKTAEIRSSAQAQADKVQDLEAKLDVVKYKYIHRASGLKHEQSRTAKLEGFIRDEINLLRDRKTSTVEDLKPLMEKLITVEDRVTQLNLDAMRSKSPADVNVTVPGIEHCLNLIKALSEAEKVIPSDLTDIHVAVENIDQKLSHVIDQGMRNDQSASETAKHIGNGLSTQIASIKGSIDAMVASTAYVKQLELQIARLDEAALQHEVVVHEVKHAQTFAENQATVPQEPLRELSMKITKLQNCIVSQETKMKEHHARLDTELRKTQNAKSLLEAEKQNTTVLNGELVGNRAALKQKTEEFESLHTKLRTTETQLEQAKQEAEAFEKGLQIAESNVKEKENKLCDVRKELNIVEARNAEQVLAVDQLQKRLEKEIVAKSKLLTECQESEKVHFQLEEARKSESAYREEVEELRKNARDIETLQRQLDATLQQKLKADKKVASHEHVLQSLEKLKSRCTSLENSEIDLQASRADHTALLEDVKMKDTEISSLKAKVEELKRTAEMLQSQPRGIVQFSQEIQETLSQDNLTPGTKAAFDQLIDPDMFDESAFIREADPPGEVRGPFADGRPTRRKANRERVIATAAMQDQVDEPSSREPSTSQETSVIPDSQDFRRDRLPNQVEVGNARSSSLTSLHSGDSPLLSEVENDPDESFKVPEHNNSQSKLKRVQRVHSRVSNHSDEMLLDKDNAGHASGHFNSSRAHEDNQRSSLGGYVDNRSTSRLRDGSQRGTTIGETPETPRTAVPRNSDLPMDKDKPRPNSAIKRRADSTDLASSPNSITMKRMKRNPAAMEVKQNKSQDPTTDRTAQASSSSKPTIRYSLPTGSKGSSRGLVGSTNTSSTPNKPKRTRSKKYENRFGQ